MAGELPYLVSYKNVGTLFDKIAAAKAPEAFTTKYLADTLGLKSTTDRALITLLKALGFLDPSGKPTPEYMSLKNPMLAAGAIAAAVKRAYGPLFAADENANSKDASVLKGLIAQVTGGDTAGVSKIQGTLQALLKKSDFTKLRDPVPAPPEDDPSPDVTNNKKLPELLGQHLRSEFHYNIQVHLPANATEATYLDIFNAMRKAFA